MPNKQAKARGRRPNRQKTAPNRGNRRAPPSNHTTSHVVTTLQLKQSHKKEEIYPLSLDKLISRANVGNDADIRLIGYTMSVTIATGNDCSTVSMNLGHEGPWIRRSDDTDNFNQVCIEHTVRGKSLLFKKKVLATSEREYINPDKILNSIDLRVRDPCGVIPGAVLRIEFRAHLIRRVPQTSFDNADQPATDRYEDQDVSGGSNPSPSPPAAVKHAPAIIELGVDSYRDRYYTDGVERSGNFFYADKFGRDKYTVSVTNPPQAVSGRYKHNDHTIDSADYNAAGFDGTLASI